MHDPIRAASAAYWYSDTSGRTKDIARSEVRKAFVKHAAEMNVCFGPVKWSEKNPGDIGVPEPPDELIGHDPKLLIGTCDVLFDLKVTDTPKTGRYVDHLKPEELMRLRAHVRRRHREQYPDEPELGDDECDSWIDEVGPKAEANLIAKAAVH